MNSKTIQHIALFLVPVFLLSFVLFYSAKDTTNKRSVEERQIEEVDVQNYAPKIANTEIYTTQTVEDIPALRTETKEEGTGTAIVYNNDTVQVFYRGWLASDGTVFDQSVEQGSPFELTVGVGGVIRGWDLGLVGMKQGEVRRIFIPSELGYGEAGQGTIPGNADLIFDVELVAIN